MSARIYDRVWIGLRVDGVELARVMVPCVEVSRSNGVAKYRTTQVVQFADPLPMDCEGGLLTFHDGENIPPFAAGVPDGGMWPLRAGDMVTLTNFTFEVLLDVPKYAKPEPERRRRRVRAALD